MVAFFAVWVEVNPAYPSNCLIGTGNALLRFITNGSNRNPSICLLFGKRLKEFDGTTAGLYLHVGSDLDRLEFLLS
jgi:hypothetical protein